MEYHETRMLSLKRHAIAMRSDILDMVSTKVGHFGGSMSIADILAVLYFDRMRHLDPKNPKDPKRDRLILSKGHCVLAQYAALCELGYFPREELSKLKTLDGMLQGHPDIDRTPGLEAVTGSLGQGLSISEGIAMALKLDDNPAKVFCVVGDGELAEGQIWEAAMSAVNYRLDNLCLFVDLNGVQASGTTDEVFPIAHVPERFRAFGWHVVEIDGHSIGQILDALAESDQTKDIPTCIVAHTVKGKGFPFAEGKCQFHNSMLSAEQYEEAKRIIARMRKEVDNG